MLLGLSLVPVRVVPVMAAAHLRVATLASPQLHPCGRRPAAKRMVACGAAGQSGFRWVSKRLAGRWTWADCQPALPSYEWRIYLLSATAH